MDTKTYNGKIYSIRSHQTDLIYIGSTTEKRLSARLSKHRANYKAYLKDNYRYISSFEILKYIDAYIELIEEVEKKITKDELRQLEGQHIRQNNCVNKIITGRTKQEYRETNKDKIIEQKKEYYETNKGKIQERHKEYYENNKDKILEQNKEYYEGNKDKINEHNKEYYEGNKEKIKEQHAQKYICVCGKSLTNGNKARHDKICKAIK